ncbi:MAG: glyoxalase superfamily protein [Gordonia sp. (in: high G+C Gram-positive bacteria)]|uniref:glyoxalase superfamily protein n=1 Tax=Gordonia sp. (in: high G+C Gram-positive bacteria) TaxID=84139 RepID=UPI0039E5C2E7
MTATRVVPILRMFDEELTRGFYCDFLGFDVLFEHRFEPGTRLYLAVRLGDCELHLSQHFGDGTPGSHVRIEMTDVDGYIAGLPTDYEYARPGRPKKQDWGDLEVTVTDPAGNTLTFSGKTG